MSLLRAQPLIHEPNQIYTNSYFIRPGQFSKCVCMKIKQFLCLRHTNSVSRTQTMIRMPANGNTPVIIWTKNTPPNMYIRNVYLFIESFTVFSLHLYVYAYTYTRCQRSTNEFDDGRRCRSSKRKKNDELLSQRIKTHVEKIHSREVTNCYTLYRMYVFLCCCFVSFKWIDMTHKWSKQ